MPGSGRPRRLATAAASILAAAAALARGSTVTTANGDMAGLAAAITSLDAGSGGTIQLAANGQYSFTAAADWWYGPNALPARTCSI